MLSGGEEAVRGGGGTLRSLGIVSRYSDGSYHPDDALTRAQFCKLAILTEGHGDQARGSAYRTRFSDVPGGGWAAPYINLACEEGLVAGYGDGRFGPDDPVTAVGQAVTCGSPFARGYTAEEIGPFWPEDYLGIEAGALGLLDGLPADGGAGLTRGDAALLLYRVLRRADPGRTGLIHRPLRLQGNRCGAAGQ
ncbi:MAG: S-layer homology domain-containing protein [Flavonifractor plautii]